MTGVLQSSLDNNYRVLEGKINEHTQLNDTEDIMMYKIKTWSNKRNLYPNK
jgi:hypothetical protein